MKPARKFLSALSGRTARDAAMVAVICFATFILAHMTNIFDKAYEFAQRYKGYDVEDLIVVTIVFAFLMVIYALRRGIDLNREFMKRHEAERKISDQASRLTGVFDIVSQGISMFDSDERLVVCNQHYLQMYNLSADVVKPGMLFRRILQYRSERGSFNRDAEEYRAELFTKMAQEKIFSWIETTNGRQIKIVNYPMANGGWVATHDDQTEARRREASFQLLFETNPMAMWVFDLETLCFLAVNDAAIAHYGYSRKQFLTMTILDIRTEDEKISAALIRAIPETQHGEYVGQHQRADGTRIHVEAYSKTLNYENREARLVAINDITARKLAEDDLARMRMFLDTVIENIPLPIVVKTVKDSRFTLVNKAGEQLFELDREKIIGRTPHDIFHSERADRIVAQDKESLLSDQPLIILDHSITTRDRGRRLITSKKIAIKGDDGKPEYLLTLIDDVTERRQAERRIEHMAHSDALTDLPNRAAFNLHLAATLRVAEAQSRSFAILCMDLDGFKGINDIYGHLIGDSLLRKVADRLRIIAAGVFVARLGGDEFTIIATNEGRSSVIQLTDRLRAAFVDDFEVDGHRLPQALSIGVAIYPDHGTDAKTLMNNADAALYQAKAVGSGAVRFFEVELAAQLHERAKLQTDLAAAIRNHELRLHYQPQLKITGEITGFEALARWYSPKRGVVPPSKFIPLAEESSLILPMGEWVLREACREAATWEKALSIAVNVSPIQFRHGDLPALVHSVLLETGLAPHRLELEITEGVLINDFSRAVSILRRLKALGTQIVLDDFGTGYSSLSYLRAFPFDKIKIDRSFISNLETDRHSIAIVRAVIGLSRDLEISVLAEGVETQAQHALLTQDGCNGVQGYLTGRPLPIADYAAVVGRKEIAKTYSRAS